MLVGSDSVSENISEIHLHRFLCLLCVRGTGGVWLWGVFAENTFE